MSLFDPQQSSAARHLQRWRQAGMAGVDEAGRGPLAGPVCAAAVILPTDFDGDMAQDSKTLNPKRRSAAAEVIQSEALAYGIGWADVAEIDQHNILQATYLAMRRALTTMNRRCAHILVDGNRLPPLKDLCDDARAVVNGDALIAEIGAASILAKVARDELMQGLDERYPGYGFAQHKGYGTKAHRQALTDLGPCPVHRRSFAPVRQALRQTQTQKRVSRATARVQQNP